MCVQVLICNSCKQNEELIAKVCDVEGVAEALREPAQHSVSIQSVIYGSQNDHVCRAMPEVCTC